MQRVASRRAIMAVWAGAVALVATVIWREAIDFRVYWDAANYVLAGGRDVYGESFSVGLPFTYPPFALLLFVPGGVFGATLGVFVLRAVGLFVFAEVCWVAGRALPLPLRRRFGGAWWLLPVSVLVLSSPVRETLDKGQINLVILGVCALALLRMDGFRSGFVVGLAGGVKLTPLALGIIYLRRRDWAAVLGMGAGLGASVLLGFIVLPRSSVEFWTSVVRNSNRVGDPGYVGNASIHGVLDRLHLAPVLTTGLWILLSLLVVLAGYFLIPPDRDGASAVTAAGIGATVTLLISPITWTHHWVWLPLVAAAWVQATRHGGGPSGRAAQGLWILAGTVLVLGPVEMAHLAGFVGNEDSWQVFVLGSALPVAATLALFCTAAARLAQHVSRNRESAAV